jgi:hypothetical protein
MPLAAGTRLGPYEIIEPIGAGGMVYKADRMVAVKTYSALILKSVFQCIRREARGIFAKRLDLAPIRI